MRDIRSSEEQSNGYMPTPANEFDHREERPTFHKLSDSYSDSQRSKQSHQNQRNRGRVPPKEKSEESESMSGDSKGYRRKTAMGCTDYKTKNVIHLAFGFICVFFAFNSQGFIEPTVISNAAVEGQIDPNAGYYSLAIIYGFSMAANLMVAPAVDWLGAKWSMVLGGATYTLFQMGMLFLNGPYLYFSSALLGVGSAFIWTGQGKYLTMNSTKRTAARNSGILWGLLQTSLLGGGIFLFGIFSGFDSGQISTKTRRIIYGVFTAVSLIGNCLHLLLPTKGLIEEQHDEDEKISQWKMLLSAFRLFLTLNMMLLSITFAYSGLELSYWSSVYSTAISYTKQFSYNTHKLIALNAICQGVGQIIGGACFGIMGDKFRRYGRIPIISIGFVTHIVCFALSFIIFPSSANIQETMAEAIIHPSIPLALIVGALLGFGDACWNTQMYSILVDMYHDQSAQAFSIMKFFQAAFACASFFYTPSIELPWILLILTIFCISATGTFFYVERVAQRLAVEKSETSAELTTAKGKNMETMESRTENIESCDSSST
uniref:UNC93-like protein MFSD11 n=1 Tax=Ascaris suum TaxID=6253 RepID=F1L0N7_ASCSU